LTVAQGLEEGLDPGRGFGRPFAVEQMGQGPEVIAGMVEVEGLEGVG
jgi:hypothetical protein